MSTIIVTSQPSEARYFPDPGFHEVRPKWRDLENIFTINTDYAFNQYGYNNYPDDSVGNSLEALFQTRPFILSNCNFNIPINGVIEGLKASIMISGLGTRELSCGFYTPTVYTTASSLIFTSGSPGGLHSENPFVKTIGSYTESGQHYTETGNQPYVWTPGEINHPSFGVFYSSYVPQYPEEPSYDGNEIPYTKLYWITVEIAYHIDPNWHVPDGGSTVRGFSSIDSVYNSQSPLAKGLKASGHGGTNIDVTTSGGIKSGGQAPITHNPIIISAGISLGGTSPNNKAYLDIGSGGMTLSASATTTATYNGDVPDNTFEIICTGQKSVPPNNSSISARATIFIDTVENKAYWNITQAIPGLTTIQFRGPSTKTTTGPLLFALSPTAGPFIGSISISEQQKSDLLDGKYYLQFSTSTTSVRNQISSGSISFGGKANDTWDGDLDSNGIVIAGTASTLTKHDYNVAASVLVNGAAQVSITPKISAASTKAGGSSVYGIDRPNAIVSFGSKLNGTALVSVGYRPTPTAGVAIGGAARQSIQSNVTGGLKVAGTVLIQKLSLTTIVGGIRLGGSYKSQNNYYAAQLLRGGLKAGGKSRAERLKPSTPQSIKVGHALNTPNKLNAVIKPAGLIDYVGDVSPTLDENRFKIQHGAGWCDFGENCNRPYLPKIVKNRQGSHLPSKESVQT